MVGNFSTVVCGVGVGVGVVVLGLVVEVVVGFLVVVVGVVVFGVVLEEVVDCFGDALGVFDVDVVGLGDVLGVFDVDVVGFGVVFGEVVDNDFVGVMVVGVLDVFVGKVVDVGVVDFCRLAALTLALVMEVVDGVVVDDILVEIES